MTLKSYIKNKKTNNFTIFGIDVSIKDELSTTIDVASVIKKLFKMLPSHLLVNIKAIKIGKFDFLEKRKIQAMYKDSIIYSTSDNTSSEDLLDNLIHEVAHSVEEVYEKEIFSDGEIKKEFLKKREILFNKLREKGYSISIDKAMNPNFDPTFDEFLYRQVGYKTMSAITPNLFYSPYGCTSIREYFANGFEAFYMRKDTSRLKKVSPKLFFKLTQITDSDILDKKDK